MEADVKLIEIDVINGKKKEVSLCAWNPNTVLNLAHSVLDEGKLRHQVMRLYLFQRKTLSFRFQR